MMYIVGMPKLNDSLPPTHSAMESAIYYAGAQLEGSGPTSIVQTVALDVL